MNFGTLILEEKVGIFSFYFFEGDIFSFCMRVGCRGERVENENCIIGSMKNSWKTRSMRRAQPIQLNSGSPAQINKKKKKTPPCHLYFFCKNPNKIKWGGRHDAAGDGGRRRYARRPLPLRLPSLPSQVASPTQITFRDLLQLLPLSANALQVRGRRPPGAGGRAVGRR
jgi:hypothetical protein